MTFEVGDKSNKDYNSKYSSYIIESNKFPQQTSLLGMLRYLLLTKSPKVFSVDENRITNKADAANIIGQASFSVIPNHKLDEKQDSRFSYLNFDFIRTQKNQTAANGNSPVNPFAYKQRRIKPDILSSAISLQ